MIDFGKNLFINPAHIISINFIPQYTGELNRKLSTRPAMIVYATGLDPIVIDTFDNRPIDEAQFRWFVGLVTRGIKNVPN